MARSRRPTIRDVARRAGVSVGTVSHALNHPGRVRPTTREAVLAVIRDLGFIPDESARHLGSQRGASHGGPVGAE